MKKLNYLICGLILSIIPCLNVSAMEEIFYINQNGVEMTQNEYNQLLEVFTKEEIADLSEEKFDFEMEHNYKTINTDTLYVQNTIKYDENGDIEANIETILTKEQYENGGVDIPMPYSYCGPTSYPEMCWETSHKIIKIEYQVGGTTTDERVVVSNQWKNMPGHRSFDVIGMRVYPYVFQHRAIEANQTYVLNGKSKTEYITPSENYKVDTGGAMVAIELPSNKSITALSEKLIVYGHFNVSAFGANQGINGSYQHATKDVTLSQATNITFSADGMGGVFKFNFNNATNWYDNTQGVHIM